MASQQITEEAVYLCTGNPLPNDIEQISHWLLNEPFAVSYRRIQQTLYKIHLCFPFFFLDIIIVITIYYFISFYRRAFWHLTFFPEISDIKARKGLALVDIIREVTM